MLGIFGDEAAFISLYNAHVFSARAHAQIPCFRRLREPLEEEFVRFSKALTIWIRFGPDLAGFWVPKTTSKIVAAPPPGLS